MEEEVPVFIDGKIICFIPINLDHIKFFAKWMNNPRARKYARNEAPLTVEELKKWFEPREGRIGRFIAFELWHKKDKKPIGQVGLAWIDWINGWANSFISIGEPEYWGQNIATEATELLIEYAFNELNLNKLHGRVCVENIGSWSVAEKMGFQFEGITKDDFYVDGKYLDAKNYCLLKEDWQKRKQAHYK